jgi:hypothetical protein
MASMGTPKRESVMRTMTAPTHRHERIANWLALLALLAGSIVLAPADANATRAECAGTPRWMANAEAVRLR